ncbi:response regulator [Rhodoferax aquaticus]|uniref:histidine kinase n=1 Tax=Rhodoferax aquaticus TaxID=2527691 RepID=A0A515EP69_9BURK|nr:response regulator [Rhodoferax aquaticus]QDL54415.1 response regulator [Rhodoferax aquaticus]
MNLSTVFLVVDDMEGMRRILTNSLQQMGMKHVITANNGADAWRILQNQKIDVVISDWNMPVMTGLELLKTIRASAKYSNLPVLMMTAETERHQVQVAIEAGVSEYMVKPFNVGALEAKVRKVIEHPRPISLRSSRHVPVVTRNALPAASRITTLADPNVVATKPVLLVVDDVPDNLDVLVALLGDDYQVKAANSGERALKILDSGKIPDLILLDVMMPDMDGFEVCKRIKANPLTADIPVIFLTAMSDTTDVTKGFALGAVDFVSKPAEPPILKARIETHLKLRRSFAELKRNRIALIEKNAVLEDNIRLRDEVERIAQHDLKNPIAGIISFSSSLLSDNLMSNNHKEIVKYIEQAAYSVLGMVNLSLDLYKMEQGTYEYHPSTVELGPLLQRIAKEMRSELGARQITLQFANKGSAAETPDAYPVMGDELLCYSMFNNLLKNAMEAAPTGSAIQVDLDIVNGKVLVKIHNLGAVPKDIRDTFFDKFSTSGKQDGTGLGTFSAKLFAVTQQGEIAMSTSDDTPSTTLTVQLPYALHSEVKDTRP